MKTPIEVFSDWAKDGRDEKMAQGHALSVNAMLDYVLNKLPKAFTFIDAGCGNGWVVRKVGDKNSCEKAIGIDGSKSMIEKAKSLDKQNDYYCKNLMNWTPSQKVDCVFSMEVFYYVEKPNLLIDNIFSNWLKKNGRLIMGIDYYTENKSSQGWQSDCGISVMTRLTESQWIENFKLSGFEEVHSWRQGERKNWSGTLIVTGKKTSN